MANDQLQGSQAAQTMAKNLFRNKGENIRNQTKFQRRKKSKNETSSDSDDEANEQIKVLQKQLRRGRMKIRSLRYRKMGLTPADLDLDKDHIVGTAFSLGEDEILDDECAGEEHTGYHAATQ